MAHKEQKHPPVTHKKKSRQKVISELKTMAEYCYNLEMLLAKINTEAHTAVSEIRIIIPGSKRFVEALKSIESNTEPFAKRIAADMEAHKQDNPVELMDEYGKPKIAEESGSAEKDEPEDHDHG